MRRRIAFEPMIDECAAAAIIDGLDSHNIAVTGLRDYFAVNFVLRGGDDEVLGGVLGLLWGGWLHVSHLWVAEPARGAGHGRALMTAAEGFARARGAVGAFLDTHSFQARPFYERLGYETFGAIEGYPPGHAAYFMRKSFR